MNENEGLKQQGEKTLHELVRSRRNEWTVGRGEETISKDCSRERWISDEEFSNREWLKD